MPDGPVVYARHGRRCALCDSLDPSPEHLAGHNISLCTGSSKGPLKKSRKGDMMKHLAQHGIAGPASAVLAGKWRFELNKKAYSCGFCIKLFSTITDRSNHIDNEHWRSGQNMSAWDLSTTIRGLLLQPEVEAAWQDILRSNPHLVESSLRWKLPLADGLQLRLEMGVVGEETGTVLARAAQELSSPDFGTPNQENVTSMTRPRPMVPESFSRATLRPGSFPWTDMNTSNVGLWTTQRSTAQNPSASLTNSHESLYPWNQSEHLSGSFLDLGDSEIDWSRFTS